jgi:putative oxidoreductase
MKNIIEKWQSLSPFVQGLLRIVAAFMFMSAGTMKLFAFPIGIPPNNGTVQLFSQLGLAGVLESFGGLILLLGLYTRPVAFILAGEMAVAYFQVHFPQNFWPIINNGQPAVLYCFIWLFFSSAGAGALSIDAMLKAKKKISV